MSDNSVTLLESVVLIVAANFNANYVVFICTVALIWSLLWVVSLISVFVSLFCFCN